MAVLWKKHVQTTWYEILLLEGLQCYADTQMNAYNITKVTAELKIKNVQY